MPSITDYLKISAQLIGSDPLDFSLKDDGSLVVIAPNGQKFRFTFDEVEEAKLKLTPKPKPKAQPKRSSKQKKASSS